MWPNYPGTELVGTAFKLRQSMIYLTINEVEKQWKFNNEVVTRRGCTVVDTTAATDFENPDRTLIKTIFVHAHTLCHFLILKKSGKV